MDSFILKGEGILAQTGGVQIEAEESFQRIGFFGERVFGRIHKFK